MSDFYTEEEIRALIDAEVNLAFADANPTTLANSRKRPLPQSDSDSDSSDSDSDSVSDEPAAKFARVTAPEDTDIAFQVDDVETEHPAPVEAASIENVPEDTLGHVASMLGFDNSLGLREVSKSFNKTFDPSQTAMRPVMNRHGIAAAKFGFKRMKDSTFQHVFIGQVQSGKTRYIQKCCRFILDENMIPIVVLRNIKADLDQFCGRMPGNSAWAISDVNNRTGMPNNTVFVALANKASLTKVRNALQKHAAARQFALVIDESDFAYQSSDHDKAATEIGLTELVKSSGNVYNFSATQASLLHHLGRNNVPHGYTVLPTPTNYYGYNSMGQNQTLEVRAFPPSMVHLGNGDYSGTAFGREDFTEETMSDKPNIHQVYGYGSSLDRAWIIHNTDCRKFAQQQIGLYVSAKFPQFVVLIFNGDGVTVQAPNQEDIEFETLSGALQAYKGNRYLTVIAGHMASRGISFVSSDHEAHCNMQYLGISSRSHGERLLQSIRLAGIYRDNTNLSLFASPRLFQALDRQHLEYENPADFYRVQAGEGASYRPALYPAPATEGQ